MENFTRNLEKYAELAIQMGLNVQQDQTVVIFAPLESVQFVRLLVKKAYEQGAREVHLEWNDEQLTLMKYKLAPDQAFEEYPAWRANGYAEWAENGAAFLTLYSPAPGLLKEVDPLRVAAAAKTSAMALEKYRSYTKANKVCWTIIAYPTVEWAKQVFPDISAGEAIAALWDILFKVTYTNHDSPTKTWQGHNHKLSQIVNYLNEKQYKQLSYEATGTKLTVELPRGHIWKGGEAYSESGTRFNPNLPTEEVYTMPHKDGVNGAVRSTRPLNYGGMLIENFTLVFEKGKVVDYSAEQGYETLKHLLETDEGSRRLGEIALVPYSSPISLSQLVFYNTLLDENASCHFALGQSYPTTIAGGNGMSDAELASHGGNKSHVHVDFMIGSAELNVDGMTADGKCEAIFRKGNWAF
ncbi:aminopeptidase [Brevibacillus nitrificans]|uniref:Aminopeptidase n=1 Tax=Brevibacillus nitrificans TaxID=651560 RepID=A0A3M8CYD0_9BACL|nr:aminopeptidase [Brevibacillus nitrificans]RNB80321.1 aminopeptidase [Brevibacillus nitrificans]